MLRSSSKKKVHIIQILLSCIHLSAITKSPKFPNIYSFQYVLGIQSITEISISCCSFLKVKYKGSLLPSKSFGLIVQTLLLYRKELELTASMQSFWSMIIMYAQANFSRTPLSVSVCVEVRTTLGLDASFFMAVTQPKHLRHKCIWKLAF